MKPQQDLKALTDTTKPIADQSAPRPAPDDDVLLIADMARLLNTSTRTIARLIRSQRLPFPEMAKRSLSRRTTHRWSRAVVQRILDSGLKPSQSARRKQKERLGV
jgi:hypothetical protein